MSGVTSDQCKEQPMNCVRGKKIYTGKKVVDNAYLVFNGSKVVGVSREKKGKLIGRFPVVTPAFIDPHSHIAMVRAGEPGAEAEANEQMDSILAVPDALDSVQMDDAALMDAVEAGVLYSCVLPGSGNIIGGLSAVIRNFAKDTNDALVARAGIKAAFGYNPMSTVAWKGKRPSTRMGALAILRAKLTTLSRRWPSTSVPRARRRRRSPSPPRRPCSATSCRGSRCSACTSTR